MRLIDADDLMSEFAEFVKSSNNSDFAKVPTWNDAVSLVDSQPTAYDVDKVVEELELLSENEEYNDLNTYEEKAAYNNAYFKAIEIVKAGGVDE